MNVDFCHENVLHKLCLPQNGISWQLEFNLNKYCLLF